MRGILEAMHDYPDEALGLCFFLDKLKNPTCATCVHLHDREWAKRYGKVCCSIWQVCDHYINPNRKYDREQKTYTRRPSNKACPNYEYGDDNFENRKRCLKKKNTR